MKRQILQGLWFFLWALFLFGCDEQQLSTVAEHPVHPTAANISERAVAPRGEDGLTDREAPIRPSGPINTHTMQGKRDQILRDFMDSNGITQPLYDSVLDLNYDGFDDYVIGFYSASGTGIKNGIEVYLYRPNRRSYRFDSTLSSLRNPSFFLDRKQLTGFYIGLGGGSGEMLEWKHKRWTVTRSFYVHNDDNNTKWTISFPGSSKGDSVVRAPFQMTPHQFALETDLHMLPYH